MFKNYFKIAWRNINRNKGYAAINVVGLSLGIACSILIFALISYHRSFDGFHKDSDRIYRLTTEWHEDQTNYSGAVPTPLGKAFRNDVSFAEKTARVLAFEGTLITIPDEKGNKKFVEPNGIAYAEPAFFSIFNFPLAIGDAATVLHNPDEAIITVKLAEKYFGSAANAMGKIVRVDNKQNYIVKGVLQNLPNNTDRRQEIYLTYENCKYQNPFFADESAWNGVFSGSQAFIKLKPGITAKQVNTALLGFSKKYYKDRDAFVWRFALQPLSDIHFNPVYDGTADKKYLWSLFFIGLFLIITACVNFVNLATAQALNRSKEVGIRKVLGSLRNQLFWQFIAETALITLVASFFALVIALIALPSINELFQSRMELHPLTNLSLLVFMMVVTAVVVFLSGSYPGLVLARFNPALALKSKLSQKHIGGFSLRRILVVTQFAISQVLIISTIVIASQMHYSQTADLGYRKDAVVLLNLPVNDKSKIENLRNSLAGVRGIENISMSFQAPAADANRNTGIQFDNRAEPEHWSINMKQADDQYLKTFAISLVAGRNFYPSDTTTEYLLNETAVKKLGLRSPEDALNKPVKINGRKGVITGVVKDFYAYSFHADITPVCIMPNLADYSTCAIKINLNNTASILPQVEKIWNGLFPDYLYSYSFMDDTVRSFYLQDLNMLKVIQLFSIIAIFIGCLGLYGLVSFMAARKTKEIGIRKVLGAGVPQILWIFGSEFTRLLGIAFCIAAPLGWWAMNHYLQDFKYRISLGAGIFLAAVAGTFLIAAVTVSYRSFRAALMNPVKSLKSE